MTTVGASTEQVPGLADLLETRRARGLDRYDEWWDGTYRIVTGPTPEHGRLIAMLSAFFLPLADAAGLHLSAPLNIGIDKVDARVPDLGIYRPDTPRTSPAYLRTAELVVEILSPDEAAGAKLDFYAQWGVEEYLEIDLEGGVRLLRRRDTRWSPVQTSASLGFTVKERALATDAARIELRLS